jgi:hypothetical protein
MATATVARELSMPERLPFLESICWQTQDVYRFAPEEMLSRYERGWRYRQLFNNLSSKELDFIKKLAQHYHSWLRTEI